MDVNMAILDIEMSIIGLFLLLLDVNSSAIAVISPNIHPNKSFCPKYINCKPASCKNVIYPRTMIRGKVRVGNIGTEKYFTY